jgi:hypothetical protein
MELGRSDSCRSTTQDLGPTVSSFAGIALNNAPAFIVSQLCGALMGLMLAKRLQIGTASIPRVDEVQIKA